MFYGHASFLGKFMTDGKIKLYSNNWKYDNRFEQKTLSFRPQFKTCMNCMNFQDTLQNNVQRKLKDRTCLYCISVYKFVRILTIVVFTHQYLLVLIGVQNPPLHLFRESTLGMCSVYCLEKKQCCLNVFVNLLKSVRFNCVDLSLSRFKCCIELCLVVEWYLVSYIWLILIELYWVILSCQDFYMLILKISVMLIRCCEVNILLECVWFILYLRNGRIIHFVFFKLWWFSCLVWS
jgi:hypothetical protein